MPKNVDALESWHSLQQVVLTLNENQLKELIEKEISGKKRRVIVLRIHMRYNKLRNIREKKELSAKTVTVRSGKA